MDHIDKLESRFIFKKKILQNSLCLEKEKSIKQSFSCLIKIDMHINVNITTIFLIILKTSTFLAVLKNP